MKNKKLVAILTLLCFMFTLMPVAAMAADTQDTVILKIGSADVYKNGEKITTDVVPTIVDGRTLVPVRVIIEAMDGEVDWNEATRTVTITIDGKVLKLVIDEEIAGFGTGAKIIESRTMVPIRYISEYVGLAVKWVEATQQVFITRAGAETADTYTVSFDLNTGNEGVFKNVTVKAGQTVEKPDVEYKSGRVFHGWYTNDEGKGDVFDFSTPIYSDMTLYGHWSSVSYGGGGSYVPSTPSHSHSFSNWVSNGDGTHTGSCSCNETKKEDCTKGNCVCGAVVVTAVNELQDALDNAENGTIIVLSANITGDVTVTQKPDVKVTINGNNKTFAGVITVDGKSATYTTAGLTIQNLNFKADSIGADACIRLGDGTNATRYTCNVTVKDCTFDVPGAVGVKSYTGGDKNLTISGCTAAESMHSLIQAKGIDGILVEKCNVVSKNGMNFNNSTDVTIDACTVTTKGYCVRFGESSGGSGAAETYFIKNCTLKSACDDGDAVIILRGTADNSTLTIDNTTITGDIKITNTASNATVKIDGALVSVVNSPDDLNEALSAGEDVLLAAGNYTLPGVSNEDVTISGTTDTVITIDKPNYSGSNVRLEGVTVKGSGYATGIQHVDTVVYKNVTIEGEMCLYGEKVEFDGCHFKLATGQYIWTYGAKEVEFKDCTFDTVGKAILIYNEGAGASKVTVNGCVFNATAGAKAGAIVNQNCAAIEIDNYQNSGTGTAHSLMTAENTYSEYFSGEWRIKNYVSGNAITVNGTEYKTIAIDGKTMTIDSSKNVTVNE